MSFFHGIKISTHLTGLILWSIPLFYRKYKLGRVSFIINYFYTTFPSFFLTFPWIVISDIFALFPEHFSISSGCVIPIPWTNLIHIPPIFIMRYCWIKKTMPFNQIPILLFNNISIFMYHCSMSTTMKRISCKVVSYLICHVFNQRNIFIQCIHQLFD